MAPLMEGAALSPPEFDLRDDDDYVKPEVHTLVTFCFSFYKRRNEKIYRTGVVVNRDGKVRFFGGFSNDRDESADARNGGKPRVITRPISFSKTNFKSQRFRARGDLVVGNLCYDWGEKRWCTLSKIDVDTGGVYVVWKLTDDNYDDEDKRTGDEEVLICPDELVGLPKRDYVEHDDDKGMNPVDNLNRQPLLREASASSSTSRAARGNAASIGDVDKAENVEICRKHGAGRVTPRHDQDVVTNSSVRANGGNENGNNTDNAGRSHEGFANNAESSGIMQDDNTREMASNERTAPQFVIKKDDPFVKPKYGELVSYLYGPGFYRVAVLCSGNGKLRFYDGVEDNVRLFYENYFHFNKKLFRRGHFRARPELTPHCRCYDAKQDAYCILKKIDISCGSVHVLYIGEEEEHEISPDHLVWVSTSKQQRKRASAADPAQKRRKYGNSDPDRVWTNDQQADNIDFSASSEPPNDAVDSVIVSDSGDSSVIGDSDEELETLDVNAWSPNALTDALNQVERTKTLKVRKYCGVYVSSESDDGRQWYIRGKLEESCNGGRPQLLMGESVAYSLGGKASVEMLQYFKRTGRYLKVTSRKDIDECRRLGRIAESKYAESMQAARSDKSRERQTSLAFRPLQPAYILGLGNATVMQAQDEGGMVTVREPGGALRRVAWDKLRFMGYKPEPVNLDDFFRANNGGLPRRQIYSQPADFLLRAWESCLGKDDALRLKTIFERKVGERNYLRLKATNLVDDGTRLTREGALNLHQRCAKLLQRLQEDFFDNSPSATQTDRGHWKNRIIEIKNRLPTPNMMLLCGGIAPELTAYKRLNAAPLGMVILQDINLHAVGVAVAGHPDVEFLIAVGNPDDPVKKEPGNVHILANLDTIREIEVRTGGIHNVNFTNPCQSFSLAGRKEGFDTEGGQLLFACTTVVRNVASSSEMPSYLGENVLSTHEVNEKSNNVLPDGEVKYFKACASMCSPSTRKRRFATNIPPVECSSGANMPGQPPSLDGDHPSLCANTVVNGETRMVNPELKKFPCLLHSKPMSNDGVWEQKDKCSNPVRMPLTPEEAEKAMGYRDNEVGVTAYSAENAVRNRIAAHDYKTSGCLVSLKGCANDPAFPLQRVDSKQRLELLGNSVCVTLLEALMWNEQRLFPPISKEHAE